MNSIFCTIQSSCESLVAATMNFDIGPVMTCDPSLQSFRVSPAAVSLALLTPKPRATGGIFTDAPVRVWLIMAIACNDRCCAEKRTW